MHDADFKAYEQANEWLWTYDTFSNGMWQDREYAIAPYLGYSLTGFHPLFATKGGPKIERPKIDWEASIMDILYFTVLYTIIGVSETEDVRRDIQDSL